MGADFRGGGRFNRPQITRFWSAFTDLCRGFLKFATVIFLQHKYSPVNSKPSKSPWNCEHGRQCMKVLGNACNRLTRLFTANPLLALQDRRVSRSGADVGLGSNRATRTEYLSAETALSDRYILWNHLLCHLVGTNKNWHYGVSSVKSHISWYRFSFREELRLFRWFRFLSILCSFRFRTVTVEILFGNRSGVQSF